MLFTKDNFRNLNDIKFNDIGNLENYKAFLENSVNAAKELIKDYEAEIAACNDKFKSLASDVVETVQETVEPVVEAVKEEVKKAAPKKAAAKKAAARTQAAA